MTATETAFNQAARISPAKRLRGTLCLPGDKSISHRAAMLAALAQATSVLENFSTARDCSSTIESLQALGVEITQEDSTVIIKGVEDGGLNEPANSLNSGNSGTTMRLLAGILAGQPFQSEITGDPSLLSRPMVRVAEPLRLMGAHCETTSAGTGPLRIRGRRPLTAIEYETSAASAQIKSAILLAGLFADGVTTVIEREPTRDHTERLLTAFGVEVTREGRRISVKGPADLQARNFGIPGDVSSAAFFIAAAAVLEGSDLTIRDIGLNPTRIGYLRVLQEMGADITITSERLEAGEPVGHIRVRGKVLRRSRPLVLSGVVIPNVIDELPLLAVIAAAMNGVLEVRDAAELRVKESDRINATVQNLRALGASIDEHPDGFTVTGGARLCGARLDAFGDHRIAMAAAIATLYAEGDSEIVGAASVDISFPEFFRLLESVVER